MALKFWLGGQGSDRSHKLYEYMCEKAKANPGKQYLIIVPEQFVFATQRELVKISKNHGILNIDVLSFMRLAHRINDEVGSYDSVTTILDELGKMLILQHIANNEKDNLSVFGDNIDKIGYISKIKSQISEFMQYGIRPDKVDEMIGVASSSRKGMLAGKLSDVNLLYKQFLLFISEKYTTTEETLDRLSSIIHSSSTIKNSEIAFEGFTGFTPVQTKLIGTLMEYAQCINVSLMMEKENESLQDNETDLFHLTKQTISSLGKMADERHVVCLDSYKSWESENLRNVPKLHMFAGQNPDEEIKMVASRIRKLVTDGNCRYKDIAIITGDLDTYRASCERIFDMIGIPYFVDKTKPLLLNPFVEYIRAIIEVFTDNYSYESMFRMIKSGLLPFDEELINELDNYCLATGIKGRKKWHARFIKETRYADADRVLVLEELRQEIIARLDGFSYEILGRTEEDGKYSPINAATKQTVKVFATALYKTIVADSIEEKLSEYAKEFEEKGDFAKSEEYKQVYRRIMDILDELVKLIPDEIVDIRTFGNLLNAGLDSLHIGVIPMSMDYVQIGDLTRSRVGDVKALFIVGANDGVIPKTSSGSGIVSDAERIFLTQGEDGLVLAPSAREDAFTQRLYIYMALNTPSSDLYVSFSMVDNKGTSMIPSYIVKNLKEEHPEVRLEMAKGDIKERLLGKNIAFEEFVLLLNQTVNGNGSSEDIATVKSLLEYFINNDEYKDRTKQVITYALIDRVRKADGSLSKAVANALYGKVLAGSVTNLETYANCAYQYFLKYGLKLNDREQFSFEARDLGSIFHDSMATFSALVKEIGEDYLSISEATINELMDKAVDKYVASEHLGALYSSARTSYMVNKIKRIMRKTASVVTYQLRKGKFVPKYFEAEFGELSSIDELKIRLSDDEMIRLYGRVDRIDTCETDDGVYVKIIDYKSSGKKMDLAAVYEGRQLQLLVYLGAAMSKERKTAKNVIPAGVLYYHIDDPVVDVEGNESDEKIKSEILKKLKLTGLLNSDDDGKILELIDDDFTDNPTVIGPKRTKTGISKSSEVISGDDFDILQEYVSDKIVEIGSKILSGDISIPKADGVNYFSEPNCMFCDYSSVCKNVLIEEVTEENDGEDGENSDSLGKKLSNEEVLQLMRDKLNGKRGQE